MTRADAPHPAPLSHDDPARVGVFTLLGRLGAGGMGIVYFGRDSTGYPAAIKVARAEYADDPGYRSRFEREVHYAQRVHGRCIAPVLAADAHAERPWIAVAYAAGPTLREYLAREGPLHGSALTALAAGMAEALAAIHHEGIVHRDMKPDNIILTADGPKVIDFGIAQALDEASVTRTDLVVGTPGWISPERYSGQRAGPPSDMFCWGELVAYAASGRRPYGGGPPETLRHRTLHERPDTAEAELPRWLHELVVRALDHDPGRRPDAAHVFAAITGGPVVTERERVTRAATRVIARDWTVAVAGDDHRMPTSPVRAATPATPITFLGRSLRTPAALAELFVEHPKSAENWLLSEGADRLRAWLDDIGDTAYDRNHLERIGGSTAAAVAVTSFVATYLPHTVPCFRGEDVSAEGVRRLATGTPEQRRVLVEAVYAGIPLIAAAHTCGHEECGRRCAVLERIGQYCRDVADQALGTLRRLGIVDTPAERERAVGLAVAAITEPRRRAVTRVAARNASACVLPWWRWLVRRARRGDRTRVEGQALLVALRLAAPRARAAAPRAWRRALDPRAWPHLQRARLLVNTVVFWVVAGYCLAGFMAVGSALPARHPSSPETTSRYVAALAYQMELWPIYAALAAVVVALPVRRHTAAAGYGTVLVLLTTAMLPDLPRLPMLIPPAVREPLLEGMVELGDGAAAPVLLGLPASVALFTVVMASASTPEESLPPRPLLPGRGALLRASVALPTLTLLIWLPQWSLATLLLVNETDLTTPLPARVEAGYALLTESHLPVSAVLAAISYALWRYLGGHAIYLCAIAGLFIVGPDRTEPSLPVPAAGAVSTHLVERLGAGVGWFVLLVVLPGVFTVAVTLSDRLRYRRPRLSHGAPPSARVPPGEPPPHPYHVPPPTWVDPSNPPPRREN